MRWDQLAPQRHLAEAETCIIWPAIHDHHAWHWFNALLASVLLTQVVHIRRAMKHSTKGIHLTTFIPLASLTRNWPTFDTLYKWKITQNETKVNGYLDFYILVTTSTSMASTKLKPFHSTCEQTDEQEKIWENRQEKKSTCDEAKLKFVSWDNAVLISTFWLIENVQV